MRCAERTICVYNEGIIRAILMHHNCLLLSLRFYSHRFTLFFSRAHSSLSPISLTSQRCCIVFEQLIWTPVYFRLQQSERKRERNRKVSIWSTSFIYKLINGMECRMSNIIHHCRLLFEAISYNRLSMVPRSTSFVFNLLLLFLIFFPLHFLLSFGSIFHQVFASYSRCVCAVLWIAALQMHDAAVGCICVNISQQHHDFSFFELVIEPFAYYLFIVNWYWIGAPNFPFCTNKDEDEEEKNESRQKQQHNKWTKNNR